MVSALTKPDDMENEASKEAALELIGVGPPEARVVKMADRLSNILSAARTNWSDTRIRAYCDEGRRIVELGAAHHEDLAARLTAEIERLEARTRPA